MNIILDVLSAGADTTGNSIGKVLRLFWKTLIRDLLNELAGIVLLYLIHYPDVQTKMQLELKQVCGDSLPSLEHKSQ